MKGWIIAIAMVSIIASVADMLLPKSAVSRYSRLCVSLVLLYVLFTPLINNRNEFRVDVPTIENDYKIPYDNLINSEVSQRITSGVNKELNLNNVAIDVCVGYDEITSVTVYNYGDNKLAIQALLINKYNIPMEKINYGTDYKDNQ
ncbi:MAG: stage III sporulation protein AF [Eubacteriales bacterium]|nr:stage III sporulation protein AF [Eubacteriales bacterium]